MRHQTFTSVSEIVDHVGALRQEGSDERTEFNGGTYQDAKRLATTGWAEGALRASEIVDRIADRVVQSQNAHHTEPIIGFDVCGAAFDIGAHIQGVPECWSTLEPAESKKGIRVVANLSVSYSVSKEAIIRRGLAVAALVLALQSRGYVVTLDVCDISGSRNSRGVRPSSCTMVRVIDGSTGSQLDIDRIVYALAHPTMFRVLMANSFNGYRGKVCGTKWGKSIPYRGKRPDPDVVGGEYDLFIGGAHVEDAERWRDGGENWVIEEFNRQTSAV